MSKYDPLLDHLVHSKGVVEFQFIDVEKVLGFPLPASARRYAAWWSNSGGTHVQAAAWLEAGYRTEDVNIEQEKLRFVPDRQSGMGEMKQDGYKYSGAASSKLDLPAKKSGRHPLFGVWKGLVTLVPGYDYAKPAFDEWKELYGDEE